VIVLQEGGGGHCTDDLDSLLSLTPHAYDVMVKYWCVTNNAVGECGGSSDSLSVARL